MKSGLDAWYIRIPDGRVLRAATTRAVRRHVGSGRIPTDSRVRRHPDDEWASLEWTQEFADLVKAPSTAEMELPSSDTARPKPAPRKHDSIAAHLDATRLQTMGLRRFLGELMAALDLTLVRRKLMVAGLVGLLSGLVFAMFQSSIGDPQSLWLEGRAAIASALILAFGATGVVLLTRMTYIELSRLRPARWTECRRGLGEAVLRFAVVYLLVAGTSLGAIYLLRHLPPWLLERGEDSSPALREAIGGTAAVVALLLEVLLWPVCILALLLAPVLAVEECSALVALGRWCRLVWQDMNRVLVYQALAVVMAALVSLPFAATLALAYSGAPAAGSPLHVPVSLSLPVLAGVACAPFFASLAVANMFIYLNLRYKYGTTR